MSDRRRIHFFGDYLNSLNRPCSAVEIGVNKGEYLFAMVEYCRQVVWFGVDPYQTYKTFSDMVTIPDVNEFNLMYNTLVQKIASHRDRDRIKLIRKPSVEAVDDITKVDLVYIDGNHSYESVKEDIAAWEPKVRVGGIIAGHDYNKAKDRHRKIFSGVIQAVDEYAAANNRSLLVNVPGNWHWIKS